MKRSDLTEKLLDIKREKGWSWKHICQEIGGYSEVLITGAILGQMKLTKPQAANAAELFGLSKAETAMLNEVPMRGTGTRRGSNGLSFVCAAKVFERVTRKSMMWLRTA